MSSVEIMLALYGHKMRHNPKKPKDPKRDRFILSKGHCCPALYAVLADEGYFPKKELMTFRKINSRLQGHPASHELQGIEASTGPLGMGLAFANGVALAGKLDRQDYRVYVLMGDGEIQEGMVWEAAMTTGFRKLDNLVGIVDYNHLQIDGFVEDIKDVASIRKKFEAFGWHVTEADGHSFKELFRALDEAEKTKGRPTLIIAHTVKSKGVSFMENKCEYHGKALNEGQMKKAMEELK
jgi:transketolase